MVSGVLFDCQHYQNDQPFELWLEEFEDSVLANFGEVDDKRKKAILMQLCGEAVKKHVASLDSEIKSNYERLTTEITSKFKHTANETVERHIFNTMEQEEEETIEAFLMRLRLQAKKCNYTIPSRVIEVELDDGQKKDVTIESEDISESLIRDRIVVGMSNQATKTRLLREHNLTLDTAVRIVKTQEMADKRIQTLLATNNVGVNAIGRKRPRPRHELSKPQINKRYKPHNTQGQCGYCGSQHQLGNPELCPAYRQTCSKCGLKNHFARACRSRRKIDMIQQDCHEPCGEDLDTEMDNCENEDSGYASELNIGAISVSQQAKTVDAINSREWTEQIRLNGRETLCKIDTGAECNVISIVVLKSIVTNPKIRATNVKLKAYGGTGISSLGTILLNCEINGCKHRAEFHVVPFLARSILGLESLIELNLINPIASVHPITNNSSNTVHTNPSSRTFTPISGWYSLWRTKSQREERTSAQDKVPTRRRNKETFERPRGCFQRRHSWMLDE